MELSVHTVHYANRFYGYILYLTLGQGWDTEILCQLTDAVPHDTEKANHVSYRAIDMPNNIYRHKTEDIIHRTICLFLRDKTRQ